MAKIEMSEVEYMPVGTLRQKVRRLRKEVAPPAAPKKEGLLEQLPKLEAAKEAEEKVTAPAKMAEKPRKGKTTKVKAVAEKVETIVKEKMPELVVEEKKVVKTEAPAKSGRHRRSVLGAYSRAVSIGKKKLAEAEKDGKTKQAEKLREKLKAAEAKLEAARKAPAAAPAAAAAVVEVEKHTEAAAHHMVKAKEAAKKAPKKIKKEVAKAADVIAVVDDKVSDAADKAMTLFGPPQKVRPLPMLKLTTSRDERIAELRARGFSEEASRKLVDTIKE